MSSPETKNAASPGDVSVIKMENVDVGSWLEPENIALTGVNWSVAPNDYWVIAGMHGSGKRDLMYLADGLMPPLRGVYHLFGSDMGAFSDAQLALRLRVGLVFAGGQLLRHMNVKENIGLPLHYHRHEMKAAEIEDRLIAVMELTGLTDFAQRMAGTLTPHWQKRAGLARALMLEPELLLVENPLAGLDLRHARWWLDFLDQLSAGHPFLNGRKITLVVTTEDLRPWRNPHCHFALLKEQRFVPLGKQTHFKTHNEPLINELMAEPVPVT
jgi:ABC-type transporter Mla maintaining outer membrane lipid asymmetry ATPase subunit MlaF